MLLQKWGVSKWSIWRFRKLNPEGSGTLADYLGQASREWKEAKDFFNEMTEADLIDMAIYKMALAESRFIYLLKEARQKGYTAWPNP